MSLRVRLLVFILFVLIGQSGCGSDKSDVAKASKASQAQAQKVSYQLATVPETIKSKNNRKAEKSSKDYLRSKWDPIHFKPAIDKAKDEDCLACHQEILDRKVRKVSLAGVKASDALAWYQTLDTYAGEQETFHRRHLVMPYAKNVMNLKCNTCHQGNDPREETANSSATGTNDLVQRKHVDPTICVMCHGKHNTKVMGLPDGDWRETGKIFNNSCLTCHAAIRTNRHHVNFLKADIIEALGKEDSDVCFGCHGGRAWYRIPYPYPRHKWPGSGDFVPDWAKDRPTESESRFLVGVKKSG